MDIQIADIPKISPSLNHLIDDFDDVNWFFESGDGDHVPVDDVISVIASDKVVTNINSPQIKDKTRDGFGVIWTNDWLGCGLQHSLPWEYSSYNTSSTSSSEADAPLDDSKSVTWDSITNQRTHPGALSLPMQLALQAAVRVWGPDLLLDSPRTSALSHAAVSNQHLASASGGRDGDFFSRRARVPLHGVHVVGLSGLPVRFSAVHPATISFSASSSDLRRTYATFPANHPFRANEPRPHLTWPPIPLAMSRSPLTVSRTVVVDDILDYGDTGEGSGESQQSASIARSFFSAAVSAQSAQDIYLRHVLSLLRSLDIHFVFIRYSTSLDAFYDACLSHGIGVFTLPERILWGISKICGGKIVHDIMEVTEETVGKNTISISYVKRGPSSLQDDVDGNLGGNQEDVEILVTNISTDESFPRNVSDSAYNEDTGDPRRIVTIVVAGQTTLLTNDMVDRVKRCLCRLQSAIIGGVMPGAGLPELLCIVELDRISRNIIHLDQLPEDPDSAYGIASEFPKDAGSELVQVIRAIQATLEDYIIRVSVQDGKGWPAALNLLSSCKSQIQRSFLENCRRSEDEEHCSVITWLGSLSTEELLLLPAPISLEPFNAGYSSESEGLARQSGVLDAVALKKHALASSCILVKNILACKSVLTQDFL